MTTTLYRDGVVRVPDGTAEAVAIRGDRVVWTGPAAAAPFADRVVRLGGRLVTPAFVDAHVHLTAVGVFLGGLDLSGSPNLQSVLDRLAQHARIQPEGTILGTGWDETRWPERRPPTAGELERAAPGRRVFLARTDAHSGVASAAMLASLPGIDGVHLHLGEGWVALEAYSRVQRAAYGTLGPSQRRDAQRRARAHAAALGVGCLQEMSGPTSTVDDLELLLALAAEEPGPEVIAYWGAMGDVDTPRRLGLPGGGGDLFLDGSLGSHTAALSAPYADDDTCGHLHHEPAAVRDHVLACVEAGLQPGFHVIGDAAIDRALDAVEAVADALGPDRVRAARPRLEHVEMPSREAIRRMARLGVVASVQPAFDATWGGEGRMYEQRLGAERARPMNPYAAFAAAGVPLALGSDAPVTPIDPWAGVRAAVHHRTPGSGIDPAAAFAAHTVGGWRAAQVDDAGELAAGALATLAVWDTTETDADGLPPLGGPTPTCLRTVVGGAVVHDTGALT